MDDVVLVVVLTLLASTPVSVARRRLRLGRRSASAREPRLLGAVAVSIVAALAVLALLFAVADPDPALRWVAGPTALVVGIGLDLLDRRDRVGPRRPSPLSPPAVAPAARHTRPA